MAIKTGLSFLQKQNERRRSLSKRSLLSGKVIQQVDKLVVVIVSVHFVGIFGAFYVGVVMI